MTMIARKRPNDSKEVNKFKESVVETFKIMEASNVGDFLPFLGWMDLQGVIKKSKVLEQYRDGFLQKMLGEHRVTKQKELGVEEEEKTMLGNLISMQKIDPEHYSDQNIKALVIDLLTAGTDTTSNTIEWAMALLLNNPDKLKKAQVEMDKHLKQECLLQESDISNLPYLEGVIKETYRLYPGGPLLLPHENNEECTIAGYHIPKGTMLLVNAYAIQRGDNIFNGSEFMPERFYDSMFTFGMGRRKCPGEGLANKVVPLEAMYKPRDSMRKVFLDLQ